MPILRRRKKYKLKNVVPHEVSLVGSPAFRESTWLILKSMAVKLDGIAFTGKPVHAWHHVESVGEGDISLLVTALVMQAGDPKPAGGEFDAEEVAALQAVWARRFAMKDRLRYHPQWKNIMEGDSSNPDTAIVGFGVTGDKPISIEGAGDELIPENTWFLQMLIGDENGTASKVVGNKKVLNGLRVINPAVLTKGDEGFPEDGEDYENAFAASFDTAEEDIDPAELGQELGQAFAEAVEEAQDPVEDITPEQLGHDLAVAAVDGITETETVDAVALGKTLAEAGIEAIIEED